MSASAPIPQDAPPSAPAPAPNTHPDAAFYRQPLHDLITMGTGFARLLHDTAQAQAAPQAAAPQHQPTTAATLIPLAKAFAQIARAVRRCIMLAQALDKPAPDPARHRAAARKQIIRAVEDTIQRPQDGTDPEDPASLRAELHERLDAPDLEDDLATRPVADIIQDICRDLGLGAHPGTRPFQRRTPSDIAHLDARAAAPSAPRQPTPQPGTGPQPAPRPTQPAQPNPGSTLPSDPAEAIALLLRHPAPARWRQPPSG